MRKRALELHHGAGDLVADAGFPAVVHGRLGDAAAACCAGVVCGGCVVASCAVAVGCCCGVVLVVCWLDGCCGFGCAGWEGLACVKEDGEGKGRGTYSLRCGRGDGS